MKRTTTFPSSRLMWAAALAAAGQVAAVAVAAQQPPPGPPPASHVVQQGETLWGLAQEYLGDPLLWPAIYRLNTGAIADPHWIYPGQDLRIAGGAPEAANQNVAAAPAESAGAGITVSPVAQADTAAPAVAAKTPFPNTVTGPTIFSEQAHAPGQREARLEIRERHAYRAVRRGEFYSAGFLMAPGEALNEGRLLGNLQTSSISGLVTTTSAMLYSYVALVPPPGATLKVGDTLESFVREGPVLGWGDIIRPTALLRVTDLGQGGEGAGGNVTAQVVTVYQEVQAGQSVMVAPEFHPSPGGVHPLPVPADSGLNGAVVAMRTTRALAGQQDELFLNLGADDGVRPGDIFQLSNTTASTLKGGGGAEIMQPQAQVMVVYTRPRTSTALIIQMQRADIRPGSVARQIYRMPS